MHKLLPIRRWLVLATLLLSLLLAAGLTRFRVDFSFDSFFPPTDPEVQYFETYKGRFQQNDNWIQVAVRPDTGTIWNLAFLRRADSLFHALEAMPFRDTLISPLSLERIQRNGMAMQKAPVFDLSDTADIDAMRAAIADLRHQYSNFISEGDTWLGGLLLIQPGLIDKPERDTASWFIQKTVEGSGLKHVISGIPYIRTQYVERITWEMIFFIGLSEILIMLTLIWLYRSVWGLVIPMLGVLLPLIWCLGLMSWLGKPVDLLGELLPPMLFVVGMSDIIHLVSTYQHELRRGLKPMDAMHTSLKEIGLALFLTSFTTMAGFASMAIADMIPLRDFGIYAAIGVIFAWVIAVALVPSLLLRVKPERMTARAGSNQSPFWERLTRWIDLMTRTRNGVILAIFGSILLVSVYGITRISYNSYLLDDISKDDPARQAMDFFEQNFYGMRSLEISLEMKEGHSITDQDVLENMNRMEEYVRSQERVSPFLSLVEVVKNANQIYKNGALKHYKVPGSQERIDELIGMAQSGEGLPLLDQVMSRDGKYGRMSARMGDIGSDRSSVLFRGLREHYVAQCDTSLFSWRLTGSSFLAEENVKHIRRNLVSSLMLAFVVIAFSMALLFRSPRMLLISIIPNIFPLVFTAGLLGFMGIPLRASTSMVFLISFGIVVDNTIHFLSRYRLELRAGRAMEDAIRNTIVETGKAMILTTLVLLSGFILLLFSNFGGTFIVGMFTGFTLFTGLLADLFLLPVLVRLLGKHEAGKYARQEETQES